MDFYNAREMTTQIELGDKNKHQKLYAKWNPASEIQDRIEEDVIQDELEKLDKSDLLFTRGNFVVYCTVFDKIPNTMIEIGRLREVTFREIGEGTNKSIDLDGFDKYYNHLILWDRSNRKIAGSYRIGKGREIMKDYGISGFYISTLFRINKNFSGVLENSLELGRSFVTREYQRQPFSLAMLWKGIYMFQLNHPEYEYMTGPVSISSEFSSRAQSLIVRFILNNYWDERFAEYLVPRYRFVTSEKLSADNDLFLPGYERNMKLFERQIRVIEGGRSLPVLLKKYLAMNCRVIGFNVDPDFNMCLDALMLGKIAEMPDPLLENLARGLDTISI
jgi:hypothetical protein